MEERKAITSAKIDRQRGAPTSTTLCRVGVRRWAVRRVRGGTCRGAHTSVQTPVRDATTVNGFVRKYKVKGIAAEVVTSGILLLYDPNETLFVRSSYLVLYCLSKKIIGFVI